MNYEKIKADFEAQKAAIAASQEDFDKFLNGNDSAGVRVRKAQQQIRTLAQAIRNEVSEIKNAE